MNINQAEIRYFNYTTSIRGNYEGIHHIKSLPWFSIVQSMEGSYEIKLGDRPTEFTGTGGFFLAPAQVVQDITHHSDVSTRMMQNRWVFLDVRLNGRYTLDELFSFPALVPEAYKEKMNHYFDELFSASDYFGKQAILYRILQLLLLFGTPIEPMENDRLSEVASYLKEHFRESVNISLLAKKAQMSESHFFAAFKAQFHTSPINYLNHYRLTMASELLRSKDKSISEVAAEVGFSDPFYFSRIFRKVFGKSPREYRLFERNL